MMCSAGQGCSSLFLFEHTIGSAMTSPRQKPTEFPELAEDNRRIWEANARWWDDRIGDGNDFQMVLIEPATERLLDVVTGDTILDAACGAGRFARRMAELGARVVAFDQSEEFIARARERTPSDAAVDVPRCRHRQCGERPISRVQAIQQGRLHHGHHGHA